MFWGLGALAFGDRVQGLSPQAKQAQGWTLVAHGPSCCTNLLPFQNFSKNWLLKIPSRDWEAHIHDKIRAKHLPSSGASFFHSLEPSQATTTQSRPFFPFVRI